MVNGTSVLGRNYGWIVRGDSGYSGTVTNCHTDGTITQNECGGIIGRMTGAGTVNVNNCTFSGMLNKSAIGGICGIVKGTSTLNITDCYFNGVFTTFASMGGMVGRALDSSIVNITRCYSVPTSGVPVNTTTGLIIGYATGSETVTLTNCYAIGDQLCSSVTSNYHVIGCVASSIVASGTLGTDTNNSTNVVDIQGSLYSVGSWSTNNWTAGSGSE